MLTWCRIIASCEPMIAILHSLAMFVADLFKSRYRLEAENLFPSSTQRRLEACAASTGRRSVAFPALSPGST